MKFSYDRPLTYSLGPKPVSVLRIKHGVTEVILSNGRIMRLSLHVDGVEESEPDKLNVLYNVIVETMAEPEFPIMDTHEAVQ